VRLNVTIQRLIHRGPLRVLFTTSSLFRFYSQWQEDRLIAPYVASPGWVVDVGANDGLRGSNSRHFILGGFSAVCVEPDPRPRQRLESLYACREGVHVYGCCCGPARGSASLYLASNSELSTLEPSAVDSSVVISVDVRTLNDILQDAGVDVVSVLSIDVEGAEWDVLRGLDLSRWRPAFIVIETHSDVTEDVNMNVVEIARYMKSAGYQHCGVTRSNCIWANPQIYNGWLTKAWHSQRANPMRELIRNATSAGEQ
jgi:FkbM family methyltransferase